MPSCQLYGSVVAEVAHKASSPTQNDRDHEARADAHRPPKHRAGWRARHRCCRCTQPTDRCRCLSAELLSLPCRSKLCTSGPRAETDAGETMTEGGGADVVAQGRSVAGVESLRHRYLVVVAWTICKASMGPSLRSDGFDRGFQGLVRLLPSLIGCERYERTARPALGSACCVISLWFPSAATLAAVTR